MANGVYRITVESSAQRLERVGPLIPGAWSRHDDELGRRMPGEFLLDTGAYGAMIDLDVAVSLQLAVRGTREIHGIHGYGPLQQYLANLVLPAKDPDGKDCLFEQVMECVGVPSLLEENREHDARVIGILGRVFLQSAHLEVDGSVGRITLRIRDLV
ncbi:MAG: hypothetical protein WD688_18365 [Candidatus Binatia bacterium]